MANSAAIKKAMRIIWENEGNRWDDLYEYPLSERESDAIMARLRKTAVELAELFSK